jgi:hypothetical protein
MREVALINAGNALGNVSAGNKAVSIDSIQETSFEDILQQVGQEWAKTNDISKRVSDSLSGEALELLSLQQEVHQAQLMVNLAAKVVDATTGALRRLQQAG